VSLANSGANDVVLTDSNALALGASNLGTGSLTVSASGPITQTGAIVQAVGATGAAFNAGANAITLGAGNDFNGAVSFANSGANNVSVVDANGIVLGASTVGSGTLRRERGRPDHAVGCDRAGGRCRRRLVHCRASAISLGNAGNDFTGVVTLQNSGNNAVALDRRQRARSRRPQRRQRTLTVTASGPISQTAAIVQAAGAGAASFNAGREHNHAGQRRQRLHRRGGSDDHRRQQRHRARQQRAGPGDLLGRRQPRRHRARQHHPDRRAHGHRHEPVHRRQTAALANVLLASAANDFGGAVTIATSGGATLTTSVCATTASPRRCRCSR
jgi:hypothetical protein